MRLAWEIGRVDISPDDAFREEADGCRQGTFGLCLQGCAPAVGGCQFADPDCASDVCGNLVCEETAATCAEDCKDLRAVADFQNCFDPGHVAPLACVGHLFAPPTGIGLEDFAAFLGLLDGP